jgi:hypothetical protein
VAYGRRHMTPAACPADACPCPAPPLRLAWVRIASPGARHALSLTPVQHQRFGRKSQQESILVDYGSATKAAAGQARQYDTDVTFVVAINHCVDLAPADQTYVSPKWDSREAHQHNVRQDKLVTSPVIQAATKTKYVRLIGS